VNILISGGCKNGKSSLAERTAAAMARGGPLYYLATMLPRDDEDRARVRRHVASRAGKGFETVERGRDILRALEETDPSGTFLLDSVTALLANEMFPAGGPDPGAPARVTSELLAFAARAGNAVFVADFIFSDAEDYDPLTEAYRRGLADVCRALAARCDAVADVCAGEAILFKGALTL